MEFITKGYEELELSTQMIIKEALCRGAVVEVLDTHENFIRLTKDGRVEYIKEATKTSLDTYVTFHLMEHKEITKKVLAEHGFRVPGGKVFYTCEEALAAYNEFKGNHCVIKPATTNFGTGVVILKKKGNTIDAGEYKTAVLSGFTHDTSVIVEEYLEGKEYRFLVIGNEVTAVLHRVPANVEGDGVHTIEELVVQKNKNPLRGTGYKSPLEMIKLGEQEQNFLSAQGLNQNDKPAQGEIIYLRENSNISTGGDSIDFSDSAHEAYKKIALQAARAVNAKICGADLIIHDITKKPAHADYGIIELNFNPAIHMHGFPYKGKNRHPEKKILDLLGF